MGRKSHTVFRSWIRAALDSWRRLSIACLCAPLVALVTLAGCASHDDSAGEEPRNVAGADDESIASTDTPGGASTPGRIEDSWGPGDVAMLCTGTYADKDSNLAVNIPTASWYVRREDRKGLALLGGALAWDMVTVDRIESQPVAEQKTSHGILGIFGKVERRHLDGSGSYCKHNWFFPFFRYENINGERTVYPLFFLPISLAPGDKQLLSPPPYETAALDPAVEAPYDYPDRSLAGLEKQPTPFTTRDAVEPSPRDPESSLDEISQWFDEQSKKAREDQRARSAERALAESPATSTTKRAPATQAASATSGRTASAAKPAAVSKSAPLATSAGAGASRAYQVQKGDTLASIARREYGTPSAWKKIFEANKSVIPDPNRIQVGQKITLPGK